MSDIITYPEQGILYNADDAAGYLATRLSGVYSAEEDFAVTAVEGLSVQVSAGHAWVHPTRWLGRSIIMEQPTTVVLTEADPVRSRIDRIVLRYDAAAKKTSLVVLDGTPDSAEPVAPDITRTALVYDLCLAEIKRTAGSTEVTAADITDTRTDESVCGVMRDGVTGIPTAQLQAQAADLLAQLRQSIASVDAKGFYSKEEVDALLKSVNPFPVGSIYQSTDATSPAELYGGTWERIASERVLMGASSTHKAGSTVNAGLPNITGSVSRIVKPTGVTEPSVSGPFSAKSDIYSSGYESGSSGGYFTMSFAASKSSSVYGKSTTVQPAAYYVYIWHRVA